MLTASTVLEIEPATLVTLAKLDLADSALHAPRAGVGDEDFYVTHPMKARSSAVESTATTP